jgi:helix-turn-helix protein
MSESVVADFVGRFHAGSVDGTEPVRGRVLLSQRRLVLAANDNRTTVPLSSVFDVAVGIVPPGVDEYFNDTITIAYKRDGAQRSAIIESGGDDVDRFRTVLFKSLLNGTDARAVPRARVGGRNTNADPQRCRLAVGSQQLRIDGERDSLTLDLANVVHVERETRTVDGSARPTLSVRHLDTEAVTTYLTLPSKRLMNVLSRYIRLEYGDLREEVSERDYSQSEKEVLVALYSAPSGVSLPAVLGAEPAQVTMVLNELSAENLVAEVDGETTLTPKGRIAAGAFLEEVNN